jgi:uncharacterized protein YukE
MPLGIEPDVVRRGGTKIGQAGDGLKQVLDTLKAALDAEGECWGPDETGKAFAEKYVPGKDGTVDALGQIAEALDTIEQNLKHTADDMQNRDQEQATNIGRIQA